MHGSCLPFTESFAGHFLERLTVSCSRAMDGVGFIATLTTIGAPFVIPPSIPPALFVATFIATTVCLEISEKPINEMPSYSESTMAFLVRNEE